MRTSLAQFEYNRMSLQQNPTNQPFHSLVFSNARAYPDFEAIVYHSDHSQRTAITYQQLTEQSLRLAFLLRSSGITPTQTIGLCLSRSPRLIITLLGIWAAGAIAVPIETNEPTRAEFKYDDVLPALIITESTLLETSFPTTLLQQPGKLLVWESIRWDILPTIPNLSESLDLPAYIEYTSGSTGRPKGVLVSHRALNNLWYAALDLIEDRQRLGLPIAHPDKTLITAPATFDALFEELAKALQRGGSAHFIEDAQRLSPQAIQRIIQQEGVTMATFPVKVMSHINPAACPSLQDIICMGSTPDENLLLKWAQTNPQLIARNEWGVTEGGVRNTTNPSVLAQIETQINESIGHPIRNTQLFVVREDETLADLNEDGEIWLSGQSLAEGYWRQPTLTAEKFLYRKLDQENAALAPLDDPRPLPILRFYRTGDIATLAYDEISRTYQCIFRGRHDKQLKIGGIVRVELEGIEKLLRSHPHIQDAVVVPHQHLTNTFLIAYLILKPETVPPTLAEVHSFLLSLQLHQMALPQHIMVLPSFPLKLSGKLDTAALPVPTFQTATTILPTNDQENILVNIWSKTLGIPNSQISIDTPFIAYGGNSLRAMQLENEINAHYHFDHIPPFQLSNYRSQLTSSEEMFTIQNLAQIIRDWITTKPAPRPRSDSSSSQGASAYALTPPLRPTTHSRAAHGFFLALDLTPPPPSKRGKFEQLFDATDSNSSRL